MEPQQPQEPSEAAGLSTQMLFYIAFIFLFQVSSQGIFWNPSLGGIKLQTQILV